MGVLITSSSSSAWLCRFLLVVCWARLGAGAPPRPPEERIDLLEGDIVQVKVHSERNLVADPGRLWPNKTLVYQIGDEYHPKEKLWIKYAVESLSNETCVTFKQREDEEHYLYIRNAKGCAAPVGFYAVGRIEMLLQLPHCIRWGTIQHEFLHALGFWHEHTRPDRQRYVRVVWSNVIEGAEPNFLARKPSEAQFKDLPYDYGSVMHYRGNAFAKDANEPTLMPLEPGVEIGQRKKVSRIDVAKLNRLYDCGAEFYRGDDLFQENLIPQD